MTVYEHEDDLRFTYSPLDLSVVIIAKNLKILNPYYTNVKGPGGLFPQHLLVVASSLWSATSLLALHQTQR